MAGVAGLTKVRIYEREGGRWLRSASVSGCGR
jgi:hypothetical protein